MKNKLSFHLLSRWVFVPLLVGILVAWGVSPAYSDSSSIVLTSQPTLAKAASDNNADFREIEARIQELEARERQNYALVLEGLSRTMDWWFSFLAVLTAIMAIFGALIPFLMARKDKEMIEHDKEQIKRLLEEVKSMKADAEDTVEKMHQQQADAEKILEGFQSGIPSDETDSKISAAVATIEQDRYADISLRLRAEAVVASQSKDSVKAYALWNALIALTPSDASALFNAGYWAQNLGESAQGSEKQRWLNQAGTHYQQALAIKADMHEAAYNWGSTLAAEASAVSAQDLASARVLWKQAGEKYQQALAINPNKHEAANNWGNTLLEESNALASVDAGETNQLLHKAERLLLAHADASPSHVAYNLACVYGRRGDVKQCMQWLKVCQSHKTLPVCAHLREDKDLSAVRDSPEFVAWLATVCDATNTQDLIKDKTV